MNKRAGIGGILGVMIFAGFSIMIIALLSPQTSVLFTQSAQAWGGGFESIFIQHFNVVLIIFCSLVFLLAGTFLFTGGGG